MVSFSLNYLTTMIGALLFLLIGIFVSDIESILPDEQTVDYNETVSTIDPTQSQIVGPHDIKCVSYNFLNMVCKWKPGLDRYPDRLTRQQMIWSILSPRRYLCPHQNGTRCKWRRLDGPNSFKAGRTYAVGVSILDENNQEMHPTVPHFINTNHIIKLPPITGVQINLENNNRTAVISWNPVTRLSSRLGGIIYRCLYYHDDNRENAVRQTVLEPHLEIHDLLPNKDYTVELKVRGKNYGYWSNPIISKIKTTE